MSHLTGVDVPAVYVHSWQVSDSASTILRFWTPVRYKATFDQQLLIGAVGAHDENIEATWRLPIAHEQNLTSIWRIRGQRVLVAGRSQPRRSGTVNIHFEDTV